MPANSGGVDRYVRDVCALRFDDLILHVGARQWVLEYPHAARTVKLLAGDVVGLRSNLPSSLTVCLHVHSSLEPVRRATRDFLLFAPSVRYVVTLHDNEFCNPQSPVNEFSARVEFFAGAATRLAPTRYIAALWEAHAPLNSRSCEVVAHGYRFGVEATTLPESSLPPVPCKIAVIGAIGYHKGLELLKQVARSLPIDLHIVVFGYVDGQTETGWWIDDRVWLTGPFEPPALFSAVRACGSIVAFFPNAMPESFCYALSDAIHSGLRCVGPDLGAIGERLAAVESAFRFPPGSAASRVGESLFAALQAGALNDAERTQAQRTLVDATESVAVVEKHYEYSTLSEADRQAFRADSGLVHLDSEFFRLELVNSDSRLSELRRQLDTVKRELASLDEAYRGRGERLEHIERDAGQLKQANGRLESLLSEVKNELQETKHSLDHLSENNRSLRAEIDSKTIELLRRDWIIGWMPAAIRHWLFKQAEKKVRL